MKGAYDDIIHLPHHVSPTRPPMSMLDRAAQFSPFAALTGYDAAIKETGRLTRERIEPDEELLSELDRKIRILMENLTHRPVIRVTCFRPDARKAGGAYVQVSGAVKKVDGFARVVVLEDGTSLPMDDILNMEGELFEGLL